MKSIRVSGKSDSLINWLIHSVSNEFSTSMSYFNDYHYYSNSNMQGSVFTYKTSIF